MFWRFDCDYRHVCKMKGERVCVRERELKLKLERRMLTMLRKRGL
jgi:hypothetical protein